MLLFHTERQSWKRKIILSNIYRILPKFGHILYAKYHDPSSSVLQIFCSQGSLWVKWLSPKRGIIQSNFDRILWKVNPVIYIMYPNCMPDILILAQAVLQILMFTRLLYYINCQSRIREIIQSNIERILRKVNQIVYTLDTICEPNIMTLAQAVLEIFCSQGPIGL